MSVFVIKLLAIVSMLIDHLGCYLRYRLLISADVYSVMRSIGRFAFPVYAFLIVNGYRKTHDVKRYLTRLIAFAAISQVPYALFHNMYYTLPDEGLMIELGTRWFVCLIFVIVAGVAWFTTVRADWSAVWPVLALTMAVLRVEYRGVVILGEELNVFYTLALGLAAIALLDALNREERDYVKLLMQAIALFGAGFLIMDNADSGLLGVALIVAIWIARDSVLSQAGIMALWCVVKFLIYGNGISRFIGGICCLIPVFLYNGKLGKPLKLGFYAVYPVHLAILGALIVYHKFA